MITHVLQRFDLHWFFWLVQTGDDLKYPIVDKLRPCNEQLPSPHIDTESSFWFLFDHGCAATAATFSS